LPHRRHAPCVPAGGAIGFEFAAQVSDVDVQAVRAALKVTAPHLFEQLSPAEHERGKAFGVYGAITGAGGAAGLLLGGVLTEYRDWRWCLYVNLAFAVVAAIGGALLLHHRRVATRPRLDWPGIITASAGLFALVYGFSNAETYAWSDPMSWGFLAIAGVQPADVGVASATLNTSQQIGGSIGTALLNTLAASAATNYLTTHSGEPDAIVRSLLRSYDTAYWWSAGIFAAGAILCGLLLRRGVPEQDPDAEPVLMH
jgi:MFS family permease